MGSIQNELKIIIGIFGRERDTAYFGGFFKPVALN